MAAAAAALRRVSSGDLQSETGTVRLTASDFMGTEVLPPMLAAFCKQYPRIELELTLSNRNEDLLQRDADIAVRMMRPAQKALVARRIGKVKSGLFAHRRYIKTFGMPKSLSELSDHRTIGFDRDMHVLQTAGRSVAHLRPPRFNFRCDSVPAQMAVLRAGLGIGVCHVNIAARDPDLIPVLANTFSIAIEAWLVMHKDAKATQRIRLLFDHLAKELTGYTRRH
jgi:DNA-binding transcriptional LysR family regulator